MTTSKKKVCLFGLSADPPTGESGHVGIVKALIGMNEYDEIRILPVYQHTFAVKRKRLAPFEHRLNMCRAAFSQFQNNSTSTSTTTVTVSDAERDSWLYAVRDIKDEEERAKVSVGTASLLDYLLTTTTTTTTESCDFWFCLGADAFLDLTAGKWKESERVLQLLNGKIVVLHRRQPRTNDETNECYIQTLENRIRESCPDAKLLQLEQLSDISSSQVRECTDEEKLLTMISKPVLDYIKQHGLYQFAKK